MIWVWGVENTICGAMIGGVVRTGYKTSGLVTHIYINIYLLIKN